MEASKPLQEDLPRRNLTPIRNRAAACNRMHEYALG
jgi:hypothetical protein